MLLVHNDVQQSARVVSRGARVPLLAESFAFQLVAQLPELIACDACSAHVPKRKLVLDSMRIALMLGIGCGLGARREVCEDNVAVRSIRVVDSPVRHCTVEHECITGLDSLRVELIALQLVQLHSGQPLLVMFLSQRIR